MFMSDNTSESNQDSGSDTSADTKSFSEKYSDVMGKVNQTLGNVDWTQMGKYGKAAGIIAVVIIAQIIIKVVIDTINFFPILPGLLELLGVFVVYHRSEDVGESGSASCCPAQYANHPR